MANAKLLNALQDGRDHATWNMRLGQFPHHDSFDFTDADFPNPVNLEGYMFNGTVDFSGSTFVYLHISLLEGVHYKFDNVTFNGELRIGARSAGTASFTKCTFNGPVNLAATVGVITIANAAHPLPILGFLNVGPTILNVLTCHISAIGAGTHTLHTELQFVDCVIGPNNGGGFRHATLSDAAFINCRIIDGTLFEDATFKGPVTFRGTTFNVAPSFHGAKLHQSTFFGDPLSFDRQFPDVSSDDAEHRYRTLKLAMGNQQAIAEQLSFGRLELRARAVQELQPVRRLLFLAFALTSDYGLSIARPIVSLLAVNVVAGLVVYALALGDLPLSYSDLWTVVLHNAFPFVSTLRPVADLDMMHLVLPEYRFIYGVVTVTQALVSAMLLFLAGLAIRNRLRLK